MKKKVLAIVLSATLVLLCGGMAFAGESYNTESMVSVFSTTAEATIVSTDQTFTDGTISGDLYIKQGVTLITEGTVTVNGNVYVYGTLNNMGTLAVSDSLYCLHYGSMLSAGNYDYGYFYNFGSTSITNLIVKADYLSDEIPEGNELIADKECQNTVVSISSDMIYVGETASIEVSGAEGVLSYSSSNSDVALVDESGIVTGMAPGTATITITAAETDNYEAAIATVEITVEEDTREWDTVCLGKSTSVTLSSTSDQTYTFTGADGEAVSAVLTGQSSSVITIGSISIGNYSKTYSVTVNAVGKHVLNVVGSSGSVTEYYLEVVDHEYTESLVEATCEEDGYIEYTCWRCGDSYRGNTVSEALGHTYESEVTEPTCTDNGYITYTCSRCGDNYTEVIDALGHDYVSETIEPTCTEDGYTIYICSKCADSYTANEVSALGHSWDEGTIEGNTLTYTCTVCGQTKTESVSDSGGNADDPDQNADDNSDSESEDTNSSDTLAVRRGNLYYFSYSLKSGKADKTIAYGKATDEVLIGDWDGDGIDTICVRRGNTYYFKNTIASGNADTIITYGKAGDEVLVGDWDGDGVDTLAVRRGNTYYFSNSLKSGSADKVIAYGKAADVVLVGDWDGDGIDTLAVRRGNAYYISNTIHAGAADKMVYYGKAADVVLVGDWDGNNTDTLTVRRGNQYYISNAIKSGSADQVIAYGKAADEVYVGTWK